MSGNTGAMCLDKPVLPCGTYLETHVADINPTMTTKGCLTGQRTPRNTRAHGITPTQTLRHPHGPFLQPAQSYKSHSPLDWNRKNNGSKKGPKLRKHGVTVFGQAHVRTRVGRGGCMHKSRGRGRVAPSLQTPESGVAMWVSIVVGEEKSSNGEPRLVVHRRRLLIDCHWHPLGSPHRQQHTL